MNVVRSRSRSQEQKKVTNACLSIDLLPSAIFINTRQMAPQTMHLMWSCLRVEACLFISFNTISELTVLMYRCSDVCNQ